MKITTKFNLGDAVYPIQRGGCSIFIPCKTCNGTGRITITESGENLLCPKCYGRKGSQEWQQLKWGIPFSAGTIGKIDLELYAEEYHEDHDDKTQYMLSITGVGSGTLWYENQLFLSHEEAQKECDKRNEENQL